MSVCGSTQTSFHVLALKKNPVSFSRSLEILPDSGANLICTMPRFHSIWSGPLLQDFQTQGSTPVLSGLCQTYQLMPDLVHNQQGPRTLKSDSRDYTPSLTTHKRFSSSGVISFKRHPNQTKIWCGLKVTWRPFSSEYQEYAKQIHNKLQVSWSKFCWIPKGYVYVVPTR